LQTKQCFDFDSITKPQVLQHLGLFALSLTNRRSFSCELKAKKQHKKNLHATTRSQSGWTEISYIYQERKKTALSALQLLEITYIEIIPKRQKKGKY